VSALELPTDHPRPHSPTYHGAQYRFKVETELVDRLQSLSRAQGTTLHMTLLAAFQSLLARYSGQDDIAVGTPVAGRSHTALEDLVGFFVNTLVLRTDLSEDPTFSEVLERVREVSLGAYDHQDLPFEQLVEELQPERHASRSPLVQVMFQLVGFSEKALTLRDLEVTRLLATNHRVRFDLEMQLWKQPKNVRGVIAYSTDLFDASTIERMTGHFVTLLEGIAAGADQRVSQLPLLTESERHQLLVAWNDTAVDYPDRCVHQLFEQQVDRTPDAVAVVSEDEELTYGALNARANQLARFLQDQGVGPGTPVGLCLERTPELVIGIVGILKAGGAYVPLDADYPEERLASILSDSAVSVVLTQESLVHRLPSGGLHPVCLDTLGDELDRHDSGNLSCGGNGESLALRGLYLGLDGHPVEACAFPTRREPACTEHGLRAAGA